MPFKRLVESVDTLIEQGKITETVFGQIGNCTYKPKHFNFVYELSSEAFEERMRLADKVIAHAGIGTIVMALQHKKPIVIVPRMKKYSEHVNDHQMDTAKRFEEQGHILVAHTQEQLLEKLSLLETFQSVPREPHIDDLTNRVRSFISQ